MSNSHLSRLRPDDLIHVVKLSPYVYINWNCNLNETEGEGFEAHFNMLKDRIKSLHIHELWEDKSPYRELFKFLAGMSCSCRIFPRLAHLDNESKFFA